MKSNRITSAGHSSNTPVMRRNPNVDQYRGCLTEKEWRELLALEYVLTWRYSDNDADDEKRYMELSSRRWVSLYGA